MSLPFHNSLFFFCEKYFDKGPIKLNAVVFRVKGDAPLE